MRDHGLLQAMCCTNRLYPGKAHGLIVDYLGVFDVVSSALDFDEGSVKKVITNLEALETFDGWQATNAGERGVKQELRKIVYVRYKIKDQDL